MTMSNVQGQFGDTTLTKVFVGGLAWETPMETLRDYFLRFGDILEAVVISDKLSGRSKGYGFVTFKEADAAKKACEDPTPIINGRRANCNLAAHGTRRQKMTSRTPTPPPQQGANNVINNNVGLGSGKNGGVAVVGPPATQLQWYFPVEVQPAMTQFHHHQPQALPIYGYSPAYVAADYNHKLAYNAAAYYPQHMYTGASPNTFIPMYHHQQPLYHHQRTQAMGLPAHMFHASVAGPYVHSGPTTLISKPTPVGMYGCGEVAVDGMKNTS